MIADRATTKRVQRAKTVRLTCTLRRDGPLHVATCLEVPASACAPTADAALKKLRRALEIYFADGGPPPEADPPSVEFVEVSVPTRR